MEVRRRSCRDCQHVGLRISLDVSAFAWKETPFRILTAAIGRPQKVHHLHVLGYSWMIPPNFLCLSNQPTSSIPFFLYHGIFNIQILFIINKKNKLLCIYTKTAIVANNIKRKQKRMIFVLVIEVFIKKKLQLF